MYCPRCGFHNKDSNYKCVKCGQILRSTYRAHSVQADHTLGGLIPYRNASALIAYYLAVFSIIPLVGIFLGIAGFILGLKGVRFAKEHPQAKGKVHAWIGILVGGFFGFGYLLVAFIIVGSAILKR